MIISSSISCKILHIKNYTCCVTKQKSASNFAHWPICTMWQFFFFFLKRVKLSTVICNMQHLTHTKSPHPKHIELVLELRWVTWVMQVVFSIHKDMLFSCTQHLIVFVVAYLLLPVQIILLIKSWWVMCCQSAWIKLPWQQLRRINYDDKDDVNVDKVHIMLRMAMLIGNDGKDDDVDNW